MYRLTDDPHRLICVETGAVIPRGHYLWPTEWLLHNEPLPILPAYEPNTPAHHRAIRDAAWTWMAGVVQDRGYDSIENCCSYYNSAVARYKAEARAMVTWRDAVSQALEALVLDPPPGVVTWEQVCPLLPQPEAYPWPVKVELPLETVEGPITLP